MSWLEDFRFSRDLGKFQKNMAQTSKAYQVDLDRARENRSWEEEQSIAGSMFHELDMIRDEIRSCQHRYITRQAEKLLIPLPPFDTKSKDWVQSEFDGRWAFSSKVLAQLGKEVRQERRERLELVFLWPSSLIGLVGGLVGIASIFTK